MQLIENKGVQIRFKYFPVGQLIFSDLTFLFFLPSILWAGY